MAFLRGRNEDETTDTMAPAPAAPIAAVPTATPMQSLSAFIDQGSEFEGKLTFKDTVRIDGQFRGEIASQNTLIVGETGEIMATVRSRDVVISGTVTGNVFASERLVLHKTARVDGDVEAGSLAIEEGAVLNGKVSMGGMRQSPSLEALPGGRATG
jgi:cytoskeletal protein CcmA (bactofilin family)